MSQLEDPCLYGVMGQPGSSSVRRLFWGFLDDATRPTAEQVKDTDDEDMEHGKAHDDTWALDLNTFEVPWGLTLTLNPKP